MLQPPRVNDTAMGIALMLAGSRPRVLARQSFDPAERAGLPPIPLGTWSDIEPVRQAALSVNPLFVVGVALAFAAWWALPHAFDRPRGGRQRERRARLRPRPPPTA